MRHNPLFPLVAVSRRRVQAGCQESVLFLKSSVFCLPIPPYSPAYPALSLVVLDMIAVVWESAPGGRPEGWKQSP